MSKARRRHTTSVQTISMTVAIYCLLTASVAAQEESFQVIVHHDNVFAFMTSKEVSQYFLKKVTAWPDGKPVQPIELGGDEVVSTEFALRIHERSPEAVHSYWQERIFSGAAVPPQKLRSDDEVVAAVRDNPNAIGYISAKTSLTGVKRVEITYAPQVISRVAPRYTKRALAAKIEGEVVLQVLIDVEGNVKRVTVVYPLSHGLTEEAERVVRYWKYKPATCSGQAVEAEVTVTVRFHP